eukprot:714409-Prorocentrum_minimum.AAC.2
MERMLEESKKAHAKLAEQRTEKQGAKMTKINDSSGSHKGVGSSSSSSSGGSGTMAEGKGSLENMCKRRPTRLEAEKASLLECRQAPQRHTKR